MLIVKVEKDGIDRALKILKNKVKNTKLIQELRKNEYFEKPSIERREEIKKAIYVEKKYKREEE